MDYLERNQRIFEELAGVRLARGAVIGRASKLLGGETKVTSLGQYYSSALGSDIYVGLKEYPQGQRDLEMQVTAELAIIRAAEQYSFLLMPELPIFHGLLLGRSGSPIGVLTEDFSRNCQYKVWGMQRRHIEEDK